MHLRRSQRTWSKAQSEHANATQEGLRFCRSKPRLWTLDHPCIEIDRSIESFKTENKLKNFGNGAINPQRAERCGYKERAFLSPQVQSTSSGLITGPSLLEFNTKKYQTVKSK